MEMDRFKDKVVIVTGAASGIGEATTRRIVSEGGMVVMADFAKEKTALLAGRAAPSISKSQASKKEAPAKAGASFGQGRLKSIL